MALGELSAELLGGTLRFLGGLIVEVFFELLIKGLGYFICSRFSKAIGPDRGVVILVGILGWLLIGLLAYAVYDYLTLQFEIDKCLDGGGRFNYDNDSCEYSE